MITEERIKEIAKAIWEIEGCPDGNDWDHYFRAKRMLEAGEKKRSDRIAWRRARRLLYNRSLARNFLLPIHRKIGEFLETN